MKTYLPRIVWDRSKQKGAHLLVLLAIADYANADGYSYPGKKTLARKCRLSERYVTAIIRDLETCGELVVIRRPGAVRHRSNLYRINLPDLITQGGDPQFTQGGDPQFTQGGDPQFTQGGDPQFTQGVIHSSPRGVIHSSPRGVIHSSPEVLTMKDHREGDTKPVAAYAAEPPTPLDDDDILMAEIRAQAERRRRLSS